MKGDELMQRKRGGLSLRVKLLIIFFLMAVIPLILTGVVYYLNLSELTNLFALQGAAFYTRPDLSELARQMSINTLSKILGMAGIISIFALYFINRLCHSVQKVVEGAENVSSGDLDYRIEVNSKDEISVLADSFNHMAGEVKKMMVSIAEQERMERELEVARIVQMTILPDHVPPYPDLSIATYWQPAKELGGDYYDLVPISDRALGVAIGDVSGHGVAAGILASMAKSCLFTQLRRSAKVEEVMFAMNNMVFEVFRKKLLMSFLYTVIDLDSLKLTLANAGHMSPYHFLTGTAELRSIENPAYPLGVRKNSEYPAQEVKLERNDALILYSDGIVEAANSRGEQFGFERLEALLRGYGACPAGELKEHIVKGVDGFCDGQPKTDDTTLIVIKVR